MRAAAYARYSSDKQRESSIQDQVRNCTAFAERESWSIAEQYFDEAVSGSSKDRPGFKRLLADAAEGCFDVLLVDDLSRLSRDEIELKQLVSRFTYRGLRIIGVSDGFDTESKGHKVRQRNTKRVILGSKCTCSRQLSCRPDVGWAIEHGV